MVFEGSYGGGVERWWLTGRARGGTMVVFTMELAVVVQTTVKGLLYFVFFFHSHFLFLFLFCGLIYVLYILRLSLDCSSDWDFVLVT